MGSHWGAVLRYLPGEEQRGLVGLHEGRPVLLVQAGWVRDIEESQSQEGLHLGMVSLPLSSWMEASPKTWNSCSGVLVERPL